jgi:hypothetical protein
VKREKERKPRPVHRHPLEVAFIPRPEHPALRVIFRDMVLHMHHAEGRFQSTGIYYRGGAPAYFSAADLPHWRFTEDQQRFVDAIMAARFGVAAEQMEAA